VHHVGDARLAAGPGLVAAAFGIDRTHTGVDLCDPTSPLRLEARPAGEPAPAIVTAPRIGISSAGAPWTDVPWRYLAAASPSLSRWP
jgi:DNA-3-methyladenine glycosylase